MATLASIRTNILAKLVDSGGQVEEPTAAQVDAQINSVIQFYAKKTFWFTEATATGFCVPLDPLVPLPDDFGQFLQPDAVVIQQSNVRYPLQQVNPLTYDSLYVGGSGLPRYFQYADGLLQLYFPPDQAYLYYIHYKKSYADLVADGDSNDFTIYCPRLIEYQTLGECYVDYRSDPTMAAVYLGPNLDGRGGKVKTELMEVNRQSYDRSATGMLQTENVAGRSRSTIFER